MTVDGGRPRRPTRHEVREVLRDVDFPLDKEQLVACVEDQTNEPATAVIRQLRALPLATYRSLDEVLRSVEVADQFGT